MRQGIIDRFAERFGIGVIRADDGDETYVFDFEHVEGWKGESARDFGLRAGRAVAFTVRDGHVRRVRLLPAAA